MLPLRQTITRISENTGFVPPEQRPAARTSGRTARAPPAATRSPKNRTPSPKPRPLQEPIQDGLGAPREVRRKSCAAGDSLQERAHGRRHEGRQVCGLLTRPSVNECPGGRGRFRESGILGSGRLSVFGRQTRAAAHNQVMCTRVRWRQEARPNDAGRTCRHAGFRRAASRRLRCEAAKAVALSRVLVRPLAARHGSHARPPRDHGAGYAEPRRLGTLARRPGRPVHVLCCRFAAVQPAAEPRPMAALAGRPPFGRPHPDWQSDLLFGRAGAGHQFKPGYLALCQHELFDALRVDVTAGTTQA